MLRASGGPAAGPGQTQPGCNVRQLGNGARVNMLALRACTCER